MTERRAVESMSDDEFNALINGPLSHPFPMFAVTRMALALRHVVTVTGDAGAQALRDHCADRQRRDEADDG